MKWLCHRLVSHRWFERGIVLLIVLNGILLGLETSPELVARYGDLFVWGNQLVVTVFVIEAACKIIAVAPRLRLYFGNGWNLFDFTVVVLSLMPASGEFATLARLARLLRVLRLVSVIPELRLIVSTLVRSIPSMGNILMLMSIIFYVYAVAGYHLFHEADPQHWRSLGIAMLTLFRIVTLEDWTDVMYTAMESEPWSWLYFVSFVVVGTFVIINLFIAVVINNLDEAKTARLRELEREPGRDELQRQLQQTQEALTALQRALVRNQENNRE